MRRLSTLLSALALATLTATAPIAAQSNDDFVGRWEGVLETPQGDLTIVLEIEATDDGLSATMFSPDQTDQPIPTDATTVIDGSITVTVPMIQGRYEGTLTEDGTLDGTWFQGPGSLELDLEKAPEGD